jgi:hypothetical protein
MQRRPLTLDDVSNELLAEYGLVRGSSTAASYCCTDPSAISVPLTDVIGPKRRLNEDSVRNLLRGLRDGADIPPVEVYYDPDDATVNLTDGLHRWRVSLALGFSSIPCKPVQRAFAIEFRGYQPARR